MGSTVVMRRIPTSRPTTPDTMRTREAAVTGPARSENGTVLPLMSAPSASPMATPTAVAPMNTTSTCPSAVNEHGAGGRPERLLQPDLGAALDGPDGEEGAEDHRGDDVQEAGTSVIVDVPRHSRASRRTLRSW